jgi:hypothetical protein
MENLPDWAAMSFPFYIPYPGTVLYVRMIPYVEPLHHLSLSLSLSHTHTHTHLHDERSDLHSHLYIRTCLA